MVPRIYVLQITCNGYNATTYKQITLRNVQTLFLWIDHETLPIFLTSKFATRGFILT